jgi:hypothetical protein
MTATAPAYGVNLISLDYFIQQMLAEWRTTSIMV